MRALLPLLLLGCRSEKSDADTQPLDETVEAGTDADGDGYLADEDDCDDSDSQVHPGAAELCDSIDNNCDGVIDEGVTGTFYADSDGDGFGDDGDTVDACEAPSGYVSVPNDCDDGDSDTYPGAAERCDSLDNDCDGEVDEDVLYEWYADADGDTYGDLDSAYEVCDPPPGYVDNADDCDDTDGASYPGAEEVCDEADNDCDGTVDEDVTTTYYQDTDGDNYGVADVTTEACSTPTGYADEPGDCDDAARAVSPAATELCDSIDNDCDGAVDEDDAADAPSWYTDGDSDGYGSTSATVACAQPSGTVANSDDCDDSNADANPGEAEVCDEADNDCDGEVDEDSAADAATWHADNDGDGYGGSSTTVACDQPSGFADNGDDCNDASADANPGEAEVCDELDNDCDGSTDEDVTTTYYADDDGDSYGNTAKTVEACSTPSGYVTDDTDCDDLDATSNPGASEVCDEADNDCDGSTDEGVTTTYYADDDGDGHGDPSDSSEACSAPSGHVLTDTDCDDTDATVSPNGAEVCDEADNDCDGSVDEDALDAETFYGDSDGDGYGDDSDTEVGCAASSGYVSPDGDCDDADAAVNPAAAEVCDEVDNDCDGSVDVGASDVGTFYADSDGDGYGVSTDVTTGCDAPTGYADASGDCDDTDSAYSPGAAEGCDGEDYNCDGDVDSDADGDGYADLDCGGDDCNDDDASTYPEAGLCALGTDCLDILNSGLDSGDGAYAIDPDGIGAGDDPFEVSCDMSTDSGGWTMVLHLYDMGSFDEDDFIAEYGHNQFTDETWSYDGASLSDGLSGDGLVSLTGQGALSVDVLDGLWDDVRMTCSGSDDDDTESYYAQVDGYATTNGSWDLLGAASNGTSYSVDSTTNSSGLSTIYHDNETDTDNSGHYLCDYTDYAYSGGAGAPQFGFCYTDHLNNPNTSDYGDSIVSLSFGTVYGADSWSDGFTMECGAMGTTAHQNTGTVTIWVR